MQATTFLLTNRQKGAIGKNDFYMKNLVTLRFMLVSLFVIMSMAVSARIIEYRTGDGFRYRLDTEAKTAELANYNGYAKEVSISESVTYGDVVYSVTSLGYECFFYCSSLTSINIPSSVTSLGNGCFSGCSSLTSINIPSSVTSLGYTCFSDCSSLTSINIPSSVTSLREYCFGGCSSLTSINIPSSVTSLGEKCFQGCSSLTSINIPSSVTSLGEDCFGDCSSLTSIVVDAGNSVYDSRENCNAVIETNTLLILM